MDYFFGNGVGEPTRWQGEPDLTLGAGAADAMWLDFDGDGYVDDAVWDSDFDGVADRVVTDVGVASAVVLGVRVLALMLAGALVTLTTTPVGITDGTERLLSPLARLGVPVGELATMVSIAIRFIPTLSEEMRHVMTAQAARGAAVDEGSLARRARVVVSLIVPLFASALRHAEGLGDAMEARCYVGGEGRTHYHVLALRRVDAAGIAVVAAYLAVVVAMAVAR